MKLSEFKGEAALDALAELIEPACEIAADKEILKQKNKAKMISYAIKNHKKSVIKILSVLDGVSNVEEYEINLLTLPIKLMEILNDPEIVQLFTSQGQTGDAKSSGSASENAEI